MHALEDRIELLERRVRRSRYLTVGALATTLLIVATGAQPAPTDALDVKELRADVVSTSNLTLRDAQGRARATLRLGQQGEPLIALLDEATKVRLLLTLVQNNHPLIQISNADEEPQLNLFYNRELGAALTMNGTGGRTLLALPTGGTPRLEFNDAAGAATFVAP